MSEEHRKLHRRKSFKTVRFLQTPGGDGIECRMSDMHSQGARLTFKGSVPEVGKDVYIMILPEQILKAAVPKWKTSSEIGIKFKEPIQYLVKHDHVNHV